MTDLETNIKFVSGYSVVTCEWYNGQPTKSKSVASYKEINEDNYFTGRWKVTNRELVEFEISLIVNTRVEKWLDSEDIKITDVYTNSCHE